MLLDQEAGIDEQGADTGTPSQTRPPGSLDADTLDDVMDTLDALRDGGRVVGVVSHVAEIRDLGTDLSGYRQVPGKRPQSMSCPGLAARDRRGRKSPDSSHFWEEASATTEIDESAHGAGRKVVRRPQPKRG